jgi:penicillin-binding protein 1A
MMYDPTHAAGIIADRGRRFFDGFGDDAPLIFNALLVGEDRRGLMHNGIDFRSLLRGALNFPRTRRLQGVSTIEQQIVRVIYQRSASRYFHKPRELALSVKLSQCNEKRSVWAAYLHMAYYGTLLQGYAAARGFFEPSGGKLSPAAAAAIVACLKYPKPRNYSEGWQRKHCRRKAFILSRIGTTYVAEVDVLSEIGSQSSGSNSRSSSASLLLVPSEHAD